ncbi:DUF2336 domain-containing protein [Roseibium porphyridii]|uniref:DUF2336 domain-containing protein n=1 Tax=Roseibium porphyridii TaxID=2866279 RepID=A0ABY8F554_9HYPH|nr:MULTISPECIES: DUF2336 domain-containing protein [Stappiaceae]QFT33125.1 hypothetical protein FIV00_21715 [Labrenzia sp. THAF82]WFE88415.1 DUF2336 domain-containing protein [Roseibium sp. KMA01]
MIEDILNLAQETTPEKRHQLVEHVTELFVNGADSYQTEEITLFNTVLEKMLPTMEREQKKDVSEQLAPIDSTSTEIANQLAREEIDIARPMLTQSKALASEDILRLAKTMGQGHLLAISKRDNLEPKVTDVLLERGESPVKQSVAANSGAEFSDWGSRLLIKLAERDDKIRDAMMERADVSEADYEKLIAQMPSEQQKRIREMRSQNEELIHDLFHKASKVVASSKLERKATRIDSKAVLKEIRAGQRTLGKAITKLALSNNLLDICFLLAEMAGLEQKYVTNVMVRYDATGVAVLCRALGVDNTDYTALCKARAMHNKQPQSTVENWINDYQSLTDRDARRLLSFMKIRLSSLESEAAA